MYFQNNSAEIREPTSWHLLKSKKNRKCNEFDEHNINNRFGIEWTNSNYQLTEKGDELADHAKNVFVAL